MSALLSSILLAVATSTGSGATVELPASEDSPLICTSSTTWELVRRRVRLSDERYRLALVEIGRLKILRDQWRDHAVQLEQTLETCSASNLETNEKLVNAQYQSMECVRALDICEAEKLSPLELGMGAGGVAVGGALLGLGLCALGGR